MNSQPSKCYVCLAALILTIAALLGTLPTHAAEKRTDITADASAGILERLFFFGESTTAHLCRHGGILDNPTDARRVLRDESGTRMLDRRILSSPVLLQNGNGETQKICFSDALKKLTPQYLVLSFGLNGIMGFIRNPQSFFDAYTTLIQGIRKESPNTRIILQSVYPVRSAENYSVDVDTLNAHIRTLNAWIQEIATQQHVDFANTASILQDTDGSLLAKYDVGDGIHLTNEAYRDILSYLCAHASQIAWATSQKERM